MGSLFYQEVRGSITRCDPITPEQVKTCSEDNLTYERLASILEGFGLSIKYVVHDSSRKYQNTFYADYDNGLYMCIYLNRDFIEGTGLIEMEQLGEMAKKGNEHLLAKEWDDFYFYTVPLPMMIHDFQKRVHDIEPEKVFGVWHGIQKRIDYANGMWEAEILNYVFSHAPDFQKPEADDNGLVTLYRGMGKLSQPPDAAISWTIHPGNALWFANQSGRGTHLVMGDFAINDIVAYDPGFINENEVIVRPGTVKNVRYEDMFPAEEKTFLTLTLSSLLEYQFYGRQAMALGYIDESPLLEAYGIAVHGIKHILRVLMLSLVYVHRSGERLTTADRDILVYFALLHDIGRISEGTDDNHGKESVDCIKSKSLRIRGIELTESEYCIAHLIIRYHSREDDEGIAAILSQPGFKKKDKDRAMWLYRIAKDMDGLDRVRFNGLDYRMLRTKFARKLPLIAGCLLKEDMIKALGL